MKQELIHEIGVNLKIKEKQITAVLSLLEEKNTIPFIARYRKEATNGLDEEQIRSIQEVYLYQVNLMKRKEDVVRLIEEKGMMTEKLKEAILKAEKLVDVEDLYRPYKEKKKTKATEAIALGLEPLAKEILKFQKEGSLELLAKPYLNDTVTSTEEAITKAGYIIAEQISDQASYRKWIRTSSYLSGELVSKKKKDAQDSDKIYEMYYDYQERVKQIKPHRILALNRGEREKVLNVSLIVDTTRILDYLENKVIGKNKSFVNEVVKEFIMDSYKRLIAPSIEREIRSELTEKAEECAIANFGNNLEKLLLQPPMKDKMVLGFDPAYRTGCKLAVLDPTGKCLAIEVIYPHEPVKKVKEAEEIVLKLMEQYKIELIAIGNGTASRESEAFIAEVIKKIPYKVSYLLVSEAGASVYSASKLAISEFPDLTVEKRSAISIGRRVQDPLSELVKIDPESIGVGLYQHDVSNKKLSESLDFVVEKSVNQVGVNINTASPSLLKYVSGLNKKSIEKLVSYRNTHGKFLSRKEIEALLGSKAYEQSVGFLRILDGKHCLDQTAIHPESYQVTENLLQMLGFTLNDLNKKELNQALEQLDITSYSEKLGIDTYTLEDIRLSLLKPNRDPRDEMPKPLLKSDILELEDLKMGMKLQGTVRNVVDFGAFIDIGLHNDALAHISKLSNDYIKHPMEVLSVGDIVDCYVDEINLEKKKVSLSLLEPIK